MTLKAKGKILKNEAKSTFYISIPAKVFRDSQFPFEPGEEVNVEILGERVITSKWLESEEGDSE